MTTDKSSLKYQPFYCEENIWQLCQHPDYLGGSVVFISSTGDFFPMYFQKGADKPTDPILWDYHVVLLNHGNIYDFNTTLPFASPAKDYLEHSFLNLDKLKPEMTPLFRVIKANEFVKVFESDRSHMKTENGWHAPPPEWPLISESCSNLGQFTDMENLEYGKVLTFEELIKSP